MNDKYSAMLDRIVPNWKIRTSLEIIGAILDYVLELEADLEP